MRKIGAVEAGGTKMVLGIYSDGGELLEKRTIPTRTPAETLPAMKAFLDQHDIASLGIASFGPLSLDPGAADYGAITMTPKLAWRQFPLLSALRGERNIPCAIDTDVNAAVLAEAELGAAKGLSDAVYVTVGTGVGVWVLSGDKLVHGLMHPEAGHILLQPDPQDPIPQGICPYHHGCLEGLASGPALCARAGQDARDLPDDHPAFQIEAEYLAQMCVALLLMVSPQRMILGGGVMQRQALFPMIRRRTLELLNGYIQVPWILEGMDAYIVPPALYPLSGLAGAYLLGRRMLGA